MHYKDGTEAKLGDLVKGKLYNTVGEVAGRVVGLVPGSEACNVRVAFVTARQLETVGDHGMVFDSLKTPSTALNPTGANVWRGYTTTEPPHAIWPCVDYGETKALELIARGA